MTGWDGQPRGCRPSGGLFAAGGGHPAGPSGCWLPAVSRERRKTGSESLCSPRMLSPPLPAGCCSGGSSVSGWASPGQRSGWSGLPEGSLTWQLLHSSDSAATWSFNLSHQGDYAVLAAEQGMQVGVDIMKTTMPGSSSVPEFFRIMTRQFTAYEWSTIQSAGSEHQQLAAFYRHWALKESFIKAIGTGLGFNLQRVEFHLPSEPLIRGQVSRQTRMHLDEEEQSWIFEESLLEDEHHVAVALGPADTTDSVPHLSSLPPPSPFTLLSFSDLIASASPLTEEDPAYWESFKMKAEAPQRQKEIHTKSK
ncbi:L-aminoadipate-semialdehyde dehydrogenase-phosphopantetheinyl transferase isoform X1 [Echeneis naucrates]|uniref:L-aminoadipate-semialdehyde dehydrogenase-phosphopantetheinyl transferase isoform X1 n=1 Tax=Echeneis naucrates TaxID=173247 RepID=UPI001113CDE0|nr:L-aminoadipate-semialdehyde dehydrogenase-phosphopantetheinyl transferase isoform X1 [Echeneis naucrates]